MKAIAIASLEYTDKDGVKSKLEFTDSMTTEEFVEFHRVYIKQHDPFYPK